MLNGELAEHPELIVGVDNVPITGPALVKREKFGSFI